VNACQHRGYPSDLSDEQWTLLHPEVEVVMAGLHHG
jgi:hypothetical protein